MSVCGIRYGESRPTRDNKVRPDRGALESDAFNVQIGSILSVKENRTKEGVVWVLVLLEFYMSSRLEGSENLPKPQGRQSHHTKLGHSRPEYQYRKS